MIARILIQIPYFEKSATMLFFLIGVSHLFCCLSVRETTLPRNGHKKVPKIVMPYCILKDRAQIRCKMLMATLMPGLCSAFQSVNNFGNIFYRKEKRPGCALLFWIESVTKVVNRLKCTTWTRQETLDDLGCNRRLEIWVIMTALSAHIHCASVVSGINDYE